MNERVSRWGRARRPVKMPVYRALKEVVRLTGQVQNWCGEACPEDFLILDEDR